MTKIGPSEGHGNVHGTPRAQGEIFSQALYHLQLGVKEAGKEVLVECVPNFRAGLQQANSIKGRVTRGAPNKTAGKTSHTAEKALGKRDYATLCAPRLKGTGDAFTTTSLKRHKS